MEKNNYKYGLDTGKDRDKFNYTQLNIKPYGIECTKNGETLFGFNNDKDIKPIELKHKPFYWNKIDELDEGVINDNISAWVYANPYIDFKIGRGNGRSGRLANYYKNYFKPTIEKVIFNDLVTVVLWSDNTKTIVRCDAEEIDYEKGLAMAIAKKFLGTNESGSNYYDVFKRWLPKEPDVKTDRILEKPVMVMKPNEKDKKEIEKRVSEATVRVIDLVKNAGIIKPKKKSRRKEK